MSQQYTVGKVATKIEHYSHGAMVKYHSTYVVIFDGSTIILNSGGWRTATTKTRMNQTANQFGLGFRVYQREYNWYVDHNGKEYAFQDGMILPRN